MKYEKLNEKNILNGLKGPKKGFQNREKSQFMGWSEVKVTSSISIWTSRFKNNSCEGMVTWLPKCSYVNKKKTWLHMCGIFEC